MFKAVNAFIFAGSFSIGVMKAGFNLDRVLEISDTQPQENAFYFIKNYPDIPVVLPSEWENDEYLTNLKNVDLMCCNCPCSSLSQINRNASVDGKNNVHFYRLFNIFNKVKPKVFVIENAPTLIKLGFPILKDMVNKLPDYNFTIIRDYAGNHNVAMKRMRTLVVGWNKSNFPKLPHVLQDSHQISNVYNTLSDLYDDTTDDFRTRTCDDIKELYKYAIPGKGLMTSLALHVIQNEYVDDIYAKIGKHKHDLERIIKKINAKENYWDKSPYKLEDDKHFPSFASVVEYLHPHQDRSLNLKELARIMNYPDTYDFTDPNHECKIPVTQAMAQGVPANFGYYIANQVKLVLENKLDYYDTGEIVFQQHVVHKYKTFSKEEFLQLNELDVDKTYSKLTN